jgi:predicted secreted protein
MERREGGAGLVWRLTVPSPSQLRRLETMNIDKSAKRIGSVAFLRAAIQADAPA